MKHKAVGAIPQTKSFCPEFAVEKRLCLHGVRLLFKADGADYESIPMRWVDEDGEYDIYRAVLHRKKGLYYYAFSVDGTRVGADAALEPAVGGEDWRLTVFSETYCPPAWLQGGVFYQIMTDRFRCAGPRLTVPYGINREDRDGTPAYAADEQGNIPNIDFFGGNLRGIAESLDELAALGVTCLYLNPIFRARSNHKYDTGNYLEIDPAFGTEDDLRDLVARAKARGIAVILDGVFSHTGDDSVYFNKYGTYDSVGAYMSEDSPYRNWYDFRRWPDDYACWWGVRILPNVNENEPSYRAFITGEDGVVAHWMRTGIAGWRLDVADELPDDFIAAVAARVKAERPDALVLGEVWEDASDKISYSQRRKYLLGDELDSVTNYVFRDALLAMLDTGDASILSRAETRLCAFYPPRVLHCLMNVLGTHDTPRILTRLSGVEGYAMSRDERAEYRLSPSERALATKRLRVAATLQFTLPGVPCVYYGDEVGMEGFEDPFNRRCYPWGKGDMALSAFYARLGAIRRAHPCFSDGAYACLHETDGVYVFTRTRGDDVVTVGVNVSDKPFRLAIDGVLTDLVTGEEVDALDLEPLGARILG